MQPITPPEPRQAPGRQREREEWQCHTNRGLGIKWSAESLIADLVMLPGNPTRFGRGLVEAIAVAAAPEAKDLGLNPITRLQPADELLAISYRGVATCQI